MKTNAARTPPRSRGAGRLAARLGLAALSTIGIGLPAASCSLIVDTNSAQCAADADCTGALADRVCKEGLCVPKEIPPCTTNADCDQTGDPMMCKDTVCVKADCITNQQCANKNGAFSVCRKNACVKLTTDLCTTVYSTKENHQDAYLDENAFFFGSILPNEAYDKIGPVIENAAKLALDDFRKVNGLPAVTGTGKRPMVLIGCNDGPDGDKAKDAAAHLIDTLGIQAILGYAFSGTTIELATDVTIPKNVLLFSPTATSNDITQLDDNDLVWRAAPRDSFQAAALSQYVAEVEARARAQYPMIEANKLKVAIVHNNDSYGIGLADELQSLIKFNGNKGALSQPDYYKRFDYGAPDAPDLSVIAKINAFQPHIVFVFGFNEGVDPILTSVESGWGAPTDMHRPHWVFSDAGLVSDLWDKAIASEDLRTRVTGSTPGVLQDKWDPYATFLAQWNTSTYSMGGTVSADTLGPAGAYDITYMFAYSAVMVGQSAPTAPNLVKLGLRRMVPGPNIPKVIVSRANISDTFSKLQAGLAIDIEGTSGPLDFDVGSDKKYGEAASDIQIWCVPKGAAPKAAGPAFNSGRYYSASGSKMDGAFDAKCALPMP